MLYVETRRKKIQHSMNSEVFMMNCGSKRNVLYWEKEYMTGILVVLVALEDKSVKLKYVQFEINLIMLWLFHSYYSSLLFLFPWELD